MLTSYGAAEEELDGLTIQYWLKGLKFNYFFSYICYLILMEISELTDQALDWFK